VNQDCQAFEPCADKSSWGRASNPQEDCPGDQVSWREVAEPKVPMTLTTLSETREVGYLLCQVPTDVTVGWAASSVDNKSPFKQLGRLEQCE